MALPSSGAISFSQISVELGQSATSTRSLNDSTTRTLFGVASGAISMSNGYGKSNAPVSFSFAISANQVNANLRTLAVAAGWNQTSAVVATVNAGVYIYSNAVATPALTINGAWPGGVTLVNNGFIMGMGGKGAWSTYSAGSSVWQAPQAGGNAISLGVAATITNNSYIGGGGGGGQIAKFGTQGLGGGGGGAGGGVGGGVFENQTVASGLRSLGGAGGSPGAIGGNGEFYRGGYDAYDYGRGAGGGGGRIFPGTGGGGSTTSGHAVLRAGQGGGAGGGGGGYDSGTGGAGGAAGAAGVASSAAGGGGGGWGATGGASYGGSGAAGGKAIALNGFVATRNGAGTTYGAVS